MKIQKCDILRRSKELHAPIGILESDP